MRDLIVGRNDGTIEVYSYEVSQLYLTNNRPTLMAIEMWDEV